MPLKPSYASAHFAFELDKRDVGLIKSIEGGGIKADVMTYQNGANYDRWRQLGKPKFEDLKLTVGMAMSQPFYAWIESFFTGVIDRRDGAIVAADFHYKERARREFTGALIKELTFPKLDATDKNAAYLNVALAVEGIEFKPGKGTIAPPANAAREKIWSASAFRFQLEGFGDACTRVTKVDAFTIKQNIIEYHTGSERAPIKMPSQIDFPQLSFYVPETDAAPFFERFKRRGVGGEVSERTHGSITVLDPKLKDMFSLSFKGAEICNMQPDKSESTSEDVKQVKIDLFVESMEFQYQTGKDG